MVLSEYHKIALNAITIVAWALGIIISVVAVIRGKRLRNEMGVSLSIYLSLVMVTEIGYIIGAAMILAAMGLNVMHHLANLEFWKFYQIVSQIDMATVRIIGIVGWIGFIINRSISYISPGYLILQGGKKLHRYFWYSAWTEVILETLLTILIFTSLILK